MLEESFLKSQSIFSGRNIKIDSNIIIVLAVKGRGTVLLKQKDYREKILSLLSEKNTYELLKHNSLSGLAKPCTNPTNRCESLSLLHADAG